MATASATAAANRTVPTEKNGVGDDDDRGVNSADEALLEVLGLSSLDVLGPGEEEGESDRPGADPDDREEGSADLYPLSDHGVPTTPRSTIDDILSRSDFRSSYVSQSICLLPSELSVPSSTMRRLTDELVWGNNSPNGTQCDRTHETIQVLKQGETEPTERRVLTRLENFVDYHPGWAELCNGYLRECISSLLGEEYVLYKEKLNLKPPGGSGFAPHLDAPSLRVALGDDGPRTFVTVMVAIDDMTSRNGCLRVARGPWSEEEHCEVVEPEKDGNPDSGGRAGAIHSDAADGLNFSDIECRGGTIGAFNGWAPHRSAANTSPFPRRAVFLTYNPRREGDYHVAYYQRMLELRDGWRRSVGLLTDDERTEMKALESIPRI